MENIPQPSPSSDPTEGGEPIPPTDRGSSEFEVSRPADGNGWGYIGDMPVYFKDGVETMRLISTDAIVHKLNQTYSINAQQVKTIRELREEQIIGDDSRLADFWEKAQELADRAGHCQVFDEIAEALGGPRRERDYIVSIAYTFSQTITARNEEMAEEIARDYINGLNIDDLYEESVDVTED